MRLDFHSENQEPLNRVFAECLQKYIDILGRKGCNKTALEFCKFFLCLDPAHDPYGVLLRMEFYAMRAKEYTYWLDFVRRFTYEVYPKTTTTLLLFPNILLSSAIAKKLQAEELKKTIGGNENMEKAYKALLESQSLEDLLDCDDCGEALFMACLILYPQSVKKLVEKAAK